MTGLEQRTIVTYSLHDLKRTGRIVYDIDLTSCRHAFEHAAEINEVRITDM